MAIVEPFRGYLPSPDEAKEVSSPPYDVISSKEARAVYDSNKKSFLRIIKPEIEFEGSTNPSADIIHSYAKKNLDDFIKQGILSRENVACFYLYQICMGQHVQSGIVSKVSIKEYDTGLIKKHEHTRPEKENDRSKHIEVTNANTGPVFLTYKNDGGFQSLIENALKNDPYIDFEAEDGSIHRIWKLKSNLLIRAIKNYFDSIRELYIADGHHRAASASRVEKIKKELNPNHSGQESYNFFLAVIFPHDQMQILSYNRILKVDQLDKYNLIKFISKKFKVSKLSRGKFPSSKNMVSMYFDDSWYCLQIKETIVFDDFVSALDASILQDFLLQPFFKIKDPRTSERLEFIGGIKGVKEIENRCLNHKMIAFLLYPVRIKDLFEVADAGKVMPPKSTWFEPKLRSGLVVRIFD
tara:strand:- start:467 stop:1699 length:1233 start_codon:yes stop_codon:yes gene_type:complete